MNNHLSTGGDWCGHLRLRLRHQRQSALGIRVPPLRLEPRRTSWPPSAPRRRGPSRQSTPLYLYDAAGQRVKKLVRKQGGRFQATTSRRWRVRAPPLERSTGGWRKQPPARAGRRTAHRADARRSGPPGRHRPGGAIPHGRSPRQQQRRAGNGRRATRSTTRNSRPTGKPVSARSPKSVTD